MLALLLVAPGCLGAPEYAGAGAGGSSVSSEGTSLGAAAGDGGAAESSGATPSRDSHGPDGGNGRGRVEIPLLTLAVFGDFGTDSEASAQVGELVASWNPDHVFTLGDNNYPAGAAETIDQHIGQYYAQFIGNYHGRYGPGAERNRFWPAPGNHDWVAAGLKPYRDYFTLPGNERYYDVDLGLVHLFAVDSDPHEPDGRTADSVQAQWLRLALARSTACWKLVYFHHPAYSSGQHGSDATMQWPFAAWGADAVFAGHDHTYERLSVDGLPYFVVGLGGAGAYAFPQVLRESKVRYNEAHGAMSIAVGDRDITFEFVDVDGELIDTFTLTKACRR